MALVDVVNLNADASCLGAAKWLRCLQGGRDSHLMRLLRSYVERGRKVNLGPIGATVRDVVRFNPAAVDLINAHPEIFEIVLRPFAHDNALLRLPTAFRYNVAHGIELLRRTFRRTSEYYLAPEIMVTNEQIRMLRELGVAGIFLHKGRYDVSVARHVPDMPFPITGVFGTPIFCVPFAAKALETLYLSAIHGTVTPAAWASAALDASAELRAIWRDGESALLHPMAIEHEEQMMAAESDCNVPRLFLSEIPMAQDDAPAGVLRHFPLHSMKPWLDEMKMYWYVDRVRRIEQNFDALSDYARRLWLLTINSDILSAAEKNAPVIDVGDAVLAAPPEDGAWDGTIPLRESKQLVLSRSERAAEGEDYLAYLELYLSGGVDEAGLCERWRDASEAHLQKAHARVCT